MKVNLEEAINCNPHEISGAIFEQGVDRFVMLCDEPFLNDLEIVMSNDFPINEYTGDLAFPLKKFSPTTDYEDPVRQYCDNMNIYFDGHTDIYFGNYHGNTFEPTDPAEAQNVFIINQRGLNERSPQFGYHNLDPDTESLFHRSYSSSNDNGNRKVDVYILPVGYVAERELQNVSYLLEEIRDFCSGLEYQQHDDKQKIINNDGPSLDDR